MKIKNSVEVFEACVELKLESDDNRREIEISDTGIITLWEDDYVDNELIGRGCRKVFNLDEDGFNQLWRFFTVVTRQ